jgi:hypothetical protein
MSDQKEAPDPYVERTVSVRPGASASASACGCSALAVRVGVVGAADGRADGVRASVAVGAGDSPVGEGLAVSNGVGLGVSA